MRSELRLLDETRSRNVFRLTEGWHHPLGSRDVAVAAIWSFQPGSLVAEVSVYDPLTGDSSCLHVEIDDELVVGTKRYIVIRIVPRQGQSPGWIEVARVGTIWVEE